MSNLDGIMRRSTFIMPPAIVDNRGLKWFFVMLSFTLDSFWNLYLKNK